MWLLAKLETECQHALIIQLMFHSPMRAGASCATGERFFRLGFALPQQRVHRYQHYHRLASPKLYGYCRDTPCLHDFKAPCLLFRLWLHTTLPLFVQLQHIESLFAHSCLRALQNLRFATTAPARSRPRFHIPTWHPGFLRSHAAFL